MIISLPLQEFGLSLIRYGLISYVSYGIRFLRVDATDAGSDKDGQDYAP
jgi:hypothetical protein